MERQTLDDKGYTLLPPIRRRRCIEVGKKMKSLKANTFDTINATEKRRPLLPSITPVGKGKTSIQPRKNTVLELGSEGRNTELKGMKLKDNGNNLREVPLKQPTPRGDSQKTSDNKDYENRGRSRVPRPPSVPCRRRRQDSESGPNQRPFPATADIKKRCTDITSNNGDGMRMGDVDYSKKSRTSLTDTQVPLQRKPAKSPASKTESPFSEFQNGLQEQMTSLMDMFDSYASSPEDKLQTKGSLTDEQSPNLQSYDSFCSTVIENMGDSRASYCSVDTSSGPYKRDAAVNCNLISANGGKLDINTLNHTGANCTRNIAVECNLDDPSKYMQWARDEVFEFLLETTDERYKDLLEELKEKLMRPNLKKVNLFTPTSPKTTRPDDSDRIQTDSCSSCKDRSLLDRSFLDRLSEFTIDVEFRPLTTDTISKRSDAVIGVVKKAPQEVKPLPRYRYLSFHKKDLIEFKEDQFEVPDVTEERGNDGNENETKTEVENNVVNLGRATVTLDKQEDDRKTVITSSSAQAHSDSEREQHELFADDKKSGGTYVVTSTKDKNGKDIQEPRVQKSTLPWYLRVSKVKRKEGVGPKNFRKCSECKCKNGYKIKGIYGNENVKNNKFWFHKVKRTFLCLCKDCMKRHDDLHFAIKTMKREDDERPRLINNKLNNHELYVNEQGLLRSNDNGVPRIPKIRLNPKIPKIPEFGIKDMEFMVKNDLTAQQRDAVKTILQGSRSSPVDSEMVDKEMSCSSSLRNQNIFDDQSDIQCRTGGDCKHQNPHFVDFVRNRRNSENATVCGRPLEEVAPKRHMELIKKRMKEKENEDDGDLKREIDVDDAEINSRVDTWVEDTLTEKTQQSPEEDKELVLGKLRYNSFDCYNYNKRKASTKERCLSYGSVFEDRKLHPEMSRICMDTIVRKKTPLQCRMALIKKDSEIDSEEINEDSDGLHKLPILMASSEKESTKSPSSVSSRSFKALRKTHTVLPSLPKVVDAREDRPIYYKKVIADQKKRALNTRSKIKEAISALPAQVNDVNLTYSQSVNGQSRYQYLLDQQAKTEQKIQELMKQLEEVDEEDTCDSTDSR